MKKAWNTFESRVGQVEEGKGAGTAAIKSLKSRPRFWRRTIFPISKPNMTSRHLDELMEEVKNMKVQFDDFQQRAVTGQATSAHPPPPAHSALPQAGATVSRDPCAVYLAKGRRTRSPKMRNAKSSHVSMVRRVTIVTSP